MGLCKCPQRKVTNLFCFKHEVNVCDHCAVNDHKRCVIKSYLHWLKDSDYSPVCEICKSELADESLGECVRLLCYDVYHWKCLNNWANSLPTNTAPAGFTCPTCNTGIFPANNDVSPVAVALRDLLSSVAWSRAGLGLPILENENTPSHFLEIDDSSNSSNASPSKPQPVQPFISPKPQKPVPSPPQVPQANSGNAQFSPHSHNTGLVESLPTAATSHPQYQHIVPPYYSGNENGANNRPLRTTSGSVMAAAAAANSNNSSINNKSNFSHHNVGGSSGDESVYVRKSLLGSNSQQDDELANKYKRRSPLLLLGRWLSFGATTALTPRELTLRRRRRTYMLVLIFGMVVFTLLYLAVTYGRTMADSDPLLDPRANPNIRFKAEGQEANPALVKTD